jgi:hypothetical protein
MLRHHHHQHLSKGKVSGNYAATSLFAETVHLQTAKEGNNSHTAFCSRLSSAECVTYDDSCMAAAILSGGPCYGSCSSSSAAAWHALQGLASAHKNLQPPLRPVVPRQHLVYLKQTVCRYSLREASSSAAAAAAAAHNGPRAATCRCVPEVLQPMHVVAAMLAPTTVVSLLCLSFMFTSVGVPADALMSKFELLASLQWPCAQAVQAVQQLQALLCCVWGGGSCRNSIIVCISGIHRGLSWGVASSMSSNAKAGWVLAGAAPGLPLLDQLCTAAALITSC